EGRMIATALYAPPDVDQAHAEWGANCGPCAIAAILERPLADVRPLLGSFETCWHMNGGAISAALQRAGVRVGHWIKGDWPKRRGIAYIQICGPWDAPGVPVVAAYKHTHAVAMEVVEGERMVYDV